MTVHQFLVCLNPMSIGALSPEMGNWGVGIRSRARNTCNQVQVRQLYGDPMKSSFTDSGNESWEYEFSILRSKPTNFIPYVNMIHSGAEGDKKSLVIFFDKSKVVQQYIISTSKVDISQGLVTR